MANSKKRRRPPVRHSEESGKQAFFSSKTQEEPSHAQDTSGSFFQAKLEIGSAYSPSEQEADEKANEVVNGTQRNSASSAFESNSVQREAKKEEEPAAKLIQKQDEKKEEPAAKLIQKQDEKKEEPAAKLIQKQDEKKEEPAAKLIQKQDEKKEEPAAKLIQKQDEKKEEPAAKLIQKQEDKKEEPMGKLIQRKAAGKEDVHRKKETSKTGAGEGGKKSNKKSETLSLEDLIQKTKGEGMPLPEDILTEMESAFKADLSQVRIHTGPGAVQMTQMVNAHAFTHGYDIYFNRGRYDPRSKNGKHLLAHELTHVVQQKGR